MMCDIIIKHYMLYMNNNSIRNVNDVESKFVEIIVVKMYRQIINSLKGC